MIVKAVVALVFAPILGFEVFLGFQTFWGERILPNIKVGEIALSGKTKTGASQTLEAEIEKLEREVLQIEVGGQIFEIPTQSLGIEFDVEKVVAQAYSVGHSQNLFENLTQTLTLVKKPQNLKIEFLLNEAALDEYLQDLAKNFDVEILESKLEIKAGKIQFTKGAAGQKIDREAIKLQIFGQFSQLLLEPVEAKILTVRPTIPEELGEAAAAAAAKFVGKKIVIRAEDIAVEIGENEILKLVAPSPDLQNFDLVPNLEKIEKFVVEDLNNKISRPAVDAKFQFEGGKVAAFTPSSNGLTLDIPKSSELIFQAFATLEKTPQINLPVTITYAKVKTEDVNNLGIKELVGRGASNFSGSAQERIHNIKLAAARINGTLVAPGEIFSFNSTVGEISTGTGYTSAYIISKGRTILGEGGGVCQVSTTTFRAALYSGLEIIKRTAHAYRVRYYEQAGYPVGLDATIFVPTVDFQFKNDTGNHILIQAYTKGAELYFDFYGTKDGRVVEVSRPAVSNIKPAPEPQYEEDPMLLAGTTKQVDFAATGATVIVGRVVKKDGQVLHSDTFRSNYKPWQAIYKVGTKQ